MESPIYSTEFSPREPAVLVDEKAIQVLQEIFPEASHEALYRIRGAFLYDILSYKKLPPFLNRYEKEEQERLLKEGTGSPSLEESIDKIFLGIPEDVIAFYRKKIEKPIQKVDPFDLV